jgi:hypothetical protein
MNHPLSAMSRIQIPLVVNATNTGNAMVQKRTMRDTVISGIDPADMTLSALTLKLITKAAHLNNLGTNTPSELVIGVDDAKRYLYMIPVVKNTPGSTLLAYRKSQAHLQLYEAFMQLDRLIHPGVREYYLVHPTPGEVTVNETTEKWGQVTVREVVRGWGVYVDLTDVTREPIRRLSDEEKAERAAKRARTLAAKAAKKQKT